MDAVTQMRDVERPLRPGDVVKLVSGGPPLTVCREIHGERLEVVYWDGGVGEIKLCEVPRTALRRVDGGW